MLCRHLRPENWRKLADLLMASDEVCNFAAAGRLLTRRAYGNSCPLCHLGNDEYIGEERGGCPRDIVGGTAFCGLNTGRDNTQCMDSRAKLVISFFWGGSRRWGRRSREARRRMCLVGWEIKAASASKLLHTSAQRCACLSHYLSARAKNYGPNKYLQATAL